VNFHLPFVLSGSTIVPIVAVFCGALGIFLFFRGFSLLQRSASKPATLRLAPYQKRPAAAVAARVSPSPATTLRTEVIRLSSDEAPTAVSMSQQGKIAAALLKAGIPSPSSWNTEPDTSVNVASSGTKNPPALQTTKLKVTHSGNDAPAEPSGGDPKHAVPLKRSNMNPSWMLWTGIALVVLSVYVIAAHFRWL
jgi:hypothetical protein